MTQLIIGFTGTSRPVPVAQKLALRQLLEQLRPTEAHHGDCINADAEFDTVCYLLGIKRVCHPPNNEYKRAFCCSQEIRPPKPYLDRNQDIVNETSLLIACPAEPTGEALRSGTWSTVRYARKLERPVYIIRPDGSLETEQVAMEEYT